ncbi:MAG: PspC domain-containing protein [Gammaproteobacteria bacterium]|nr:PspC domain-containing protein [Gammaproteobacteria bacterium]
MSITKRLFRSRKESIIAGVCGGLGEYFNVDPVFIRILFVALALVFGVTIIFYILMWLIVPLTAEND